jgi:hypothetical protein
MTRKITFKKLLLASAIAVPAISSVLSTAVVPTAIVSTGLLFSSKAHAQCTVEDAYRDPVTGMLVTPNCDSGIGDGSGPIVTCAFPPGVIEACPEDDQYCNGDPHKEVVIDVPRDDCIDYGGTVVSSSSTN